MTQSKNRNAILAGATGLVGGELLKNYCWQTRVMPACIALGGAHLP